MEDLERRLKQHARELGFGLVGIAAAGPADGFERLRDWLARGFAGEMGYMHRHAEARRHPSSILPEVQSVIMVGASYGLNPDTRGGASTSSSGRIARYAQGADYHDVLRDRLKKLLAWVQTEVPGCRGRAVVDTAPLLERDFGRRAGLGWFGKNTMLINKRLGSTFLLGALLLDVRFEADSPHYSSHCGTCTACLDACPTAAFTAPHVLDSRRCISYLTIELRGSIPESLRDSIGDWAFGCDVCQEVCPWNDAMAPDAAFTRRPDLEKIDLSELLALSEADFRQRYRHTALMRPGRAGLLRNAAIVLGNQGDPAALPALERARHDAEPLVREAAVWAIERIHAAQRKARSRTRVRLPTE